MDRLFTTGVVGYCGRKSPTDQDYKDLRKFTTQEVQLLLNLMCGRQFYDILVKITKDNRDIVKEMEARLYETVSSFYLA